MPECKVVWVKDPHAFRWVRFAHVYLQGRTGCDASLGREDDTLVGWTELSSESEPADEATGVFDRRIFYVMRSDDVAVIPGDALRALGYVRYMPMEAVDPVTFHESHGLDVEIRL